MTDVRLISLWESFDSKNNKKEINQCFYIINRCGTLGYVK